MLTLTDLDVVIAEPSTTQQAILTKRVAAAGVRSIRQVPNVRLAMQEMHRDPPHVVLSAFHFDDGNGCDLVEKLRDDERTRGVAFLLVSSETDPDKLDRIRQAGFSAMLSKPIDCGTLRTALTATVRELDHVEGAFAFEELQVLVVDDSRFARRHIASVLSKLGITNLTFAEDGQQALEIFAEQEFDLVVTDYNMPRLNGDGLVKGVRGGASHRDVPILMVTSESDHHRLAEVHQAGVSAMCDKPFHIDQVRALISNIL